MELQKIEWKASGNGKVDTKLILLFFTGLTMDIDFELEAYQDKVYQAVEPNIMLKLPPYVRDIINTKEFQRLRDIKQLGKQILFYSLCQSY